MGDYLTNLFHGLFPTWPTMLATLLAIMVLMIVLTKFLWKPMKKYVGERNAFIQKNIDNSTTQITDAINDRKTAQEELDNARVEAGHIISIAKTEAIDVQNEIIEKANIRKKRILDSAAEEIAKERERLRVESKNEIVSVAFAAAKKIINKDVDTKINKKIIEDYIKENDR